MKEITRVHLAKTAYDIEVAAKKELERYISDVEKYTGDSEVLQDVELRMTELLAERGVQAQGVISMDDVVAMKEQLGKPQAFADVDEDGVVRTVESDDTDTSAPVNRKLYRDMDDAILGGVLGGFASYLQVSSVWLRIAFIILLFVSFGLISVMYVILWFIIPAAKTTTEKLRMSGRPVTIDSLQSLGSDEEVRKQRTPLLQTVLRVGIGATSALAAVVTLMLTIWGIVAAASTGFLQEYITGSSMPVEQWVTWVVGALIVTGLMALVAFFAYIAYMLFFKRFTKRSGVTLLAIVVLGITTFTAVIGIALVQSVTIDNEIRKNTTVRNEALPAGFSGVTQLTLTDARQDDAGGSHVSVEYVVTTTGPRYELRSTSDISPRVSVEGDRATIAMPTSRQSDYGYHLTIYGPALVSANVGVSAFSYAGSSQSSMELVADKWPGHISLDGSYETVTVSGSRSTISLDDASIASLIVKSGVRLAVEAGTVRTLDITQPDVCPAGESSARSVVEVEGVSTGMMTYNGKEQSAVSLQNSCASVSVGVDDTV